MDSLVINENLLQEAIEKARNERLDLSAMVNDFFRTFIASKPADKKVVKISPFVRNIGARVDLPDNYDAVSDYMDYLENKYK